MRSQLRSPAGRLRAAWLEEYIATLDEPRRSGIESLDDLIHTTLPELERVHANGMIGYGPFHYRYASGREGDSFLRCVRFKRAADVDHIVLRELLVQAGRLGPPDAVTPPA